MEISYTWTQRAATLTTARSRYTISTRGDYPRGGPFEDHVPSGGRRVTREVLDRDFLTS
jgi:hypothetical protein